MEDSSEIPSENSAHLLTVDKRCAGTQTPEMTRHAFADSNGHELQSRKESDTPVIVLKVDYRNLGLDPNSKPHSLAIPEVVVEYVKDTVPLKEISARNFEDGGIPNIAFNSCENLSQLQRSPQETSLSNVFLLQRPQHFLGNLEYGPGTFALGSGKNRFYYSLPKAAQQKLSANRDLMLLRSQPPSPRVERSVQTSEGPPRHPSPSYFDEPTLAPSKPMPSPDLRSCPLENGTGIYTISGRRTVVSSTMPDDIFYQDAKYFISTTDNISLHDKPKSSKNFELTVMPASVDLKRRRLQFLTDLLSLLLLILGMVLILATPALLVPLFSATRKMYLPLIAIFLAVGSFSAVVLSFSGIIGNVVWNYDEQDKKLKIRMHCGRGPIFHFWANGLYNLNQRAKNREMIV